MNHNQQDQLTDLIQELHFTDIDLQKEEQILKLLQANSITLSICIKDLLAFQIPNTNIVETLNMIHGEMHNYIEKISTPAWKNLARDKAELWSQISVMLGGEDFELPEDIELPEDQNIH